MKFWLAKPHQTEPQFLAWARDYPDLVELDWITQYVGLKAYSITVTDKSAPADQKEKLIFAVPHAHEPAGTVGCMQYLNQLLTGWHFDGTPSDLDRDRILAGCVLSFIPDANPDGRARAPVDYWDGTQYTNDEFWTFMRGRDPETKKMWKRLGRWSLQEENPETIGIVYEQINAHEYVEPNRDLSSSYFRLIQQIGDRYGYGRWLDIHQTEFERSSHNCMVLLPLVHNELPEEIQRINVAWAEAIVEAWAAIGATPVRPSKPLGYTGEQAEYFRRVWREFMPMIPQITTEVQNNNSRTPPVLQAKFQEIGIRVSVDLALSD